MKNNTISDFCVYATYAGFDFETEDTNGWCKSIACINPSHDKILSARKKAGEAIKFHPTTMGMNINTGVIYCSRCKLTMHRKEQLKALLVGQPMPNDDACAKPEMMTLDQARSMRDSIIASQAAKELARATESPPEELSDFPAAGSAPKPVDPHKSSPAKQAEVVIKRRPANEKSPPPAKVEGIMRALESVLSIPKVGKKRQAIESMCEVMLTLCE